MRMDATVRNLIEVGYSRDHQVKTFVPIMRTKPSKCSRPFVSFALWKVSKMHCISPNFFFRMDSSIRTISCQTTRPAPMLRWLNADGRMSKFRVQTFNAVPYPTSEFPINPSFSPTLRPCASMRRWSPSLPSRSMFSVEPASMAFPFLPGEYPHPS